MTNPVPTLTGQALRLRPFRQDDVAGRLALGRSPEIVRSFGGDPDGLPPYSEQDARHWVDRNLAHPLAWAIEVQGRLLGEARLDAVDHQDRRARLAIGLYDPDQLSKGLGRAAIHLVLSYGFDILGLHRIDLRVLATNERAIRCYRACGFIEEGRERESAFVAGVWLDDVIMGILAREYRQDAR
jgi:[ribosomal protein S5]-alanine N-acetyltransferase